MDEEHLMPAHRRLAVRLAVGLAQGLVLYLLVEARRHSYFAPVTQSALMFLFAYVPLLLLQGLGIIRLSRLIAWCGVAALVAAGLGAYGAWRDMDGSGYGSLIALHLFLAAGLFIAHALIEGGDIDRRFMAHYPTHFDVAWKMALQVILVAFFECAFWLLLWLGAILFGLIGLTFLRQLITHAWFAFPATALVVAAGFHLTDVQPGLVRGMRGLVLVLFSWLLPLMTVLASGFLFALLFTGLDSLWHVGHASGDLLSAAAILIILVNAMWQDGAAERPALLRHAGRVAGVILVPLVALAGYALWLRVDQYGWTMARVATATSGLVAAFYAVGYAISAAWPSGPVGLIARWNFAASLLVLAVLLALFTPLADPARIAVESQVARLTRGAVAPEKFDFRYLKVSGLRFGHDALETLSRSANVGIARRAREAVKGTFASPNRREPDIRPQALARITVYPAGKTLPHTFLAQHWTRENGGSLIGNCTRMGNPNPGFPAGASGRVAPDCEALVGDFDKDGREDVLLVTNMASSAGLDIYNAQLFREKPDGTWRNSGSLGYPHCKGDLAALRAGRLDMVASEHPDVMLGGRRMRVAWNEPSPPCPA